MRINIILFLSFFIYLQPQTNLYDYSSTYELSGETSINSQSEIEDFRKCSCDLFPDFCDHRCCCDIKCISQIKDWKDNNLCLNVDNNKLSNHYCYGRHGLSHEKNDSFTWNLNNSPLLHSDQIFKLFCVRHDRTKNKIDEKYKEDDANKIDDSEIYNLIKENSYLGFLDQQTQASDRSDENERYSFGEKLTIKINNQCVYKMDPYGKGLKEAIFRFSYPTEGFFIIRDCNPNSANNNRIKQLILKISENKNTPYQILLQLEDENIQKKTHISIIWSDTINSEENKSDPKVDIISGRSGYLVGKNVLFRDQDENQQYIIYNIGYFIYGANEKGECMKLTEEESVVNIQSIKFKQNSIYSCRYLIEDCRDFEDLLIFKSAENFETITIGKFGNSFDNLDDWLEKIDIPKTFEDLQNEDLDIYDNYCSFPTKIYLEILVSKFLTKGQPQEMIIGAKLKYSWERIVISREYKISFITKYVVVSEELFENQGKQTSLYPITSPNFRKP